MSEGIDVKIAKYKKGVQKLEEKQRIGNFTPENEDKLTLLKTQLNKYLSEKQLTNNSSIKNLNNNNSNNSDLNNKNNSIRFSGIINDDNEDKNKIIEIENSNTSSSDTKNKLNEIKKVCVYLKLCALFLNMYVLFFIDS